MKLMNSSKNKLAKIIFAKRTHSHLSIVWTTFWACMWDKRKGKTCEGVHKIAFQGEGEDSYRNISSIEKQYSLPSQGLCMGLIVGLGKQLWQAQRCLIQLLLLLVPARAPAHTHIYIYIYIFLNHWWLSLLFFVITKK